MKHDHAYTFAFNLISDHESGEDVTGSMLREGILKRLADMNDDELWENCGCPFDSYSTEEE